MIERQIDSPMPRPSVLGRIERIEQMIAAVRVGPSPVVLDRDTRMVATAPGSNPQFSRSVVDRRHCLNSIGYQIDDHLLQLKPIAENQQGLRCKVQLQRHRRRAQSLPKIQGSRGRVWADVRQVSIGRARSERQNITLRR